MFADHVNRVVRRSRAFFGAREPGHFLVHAYVPCAEPPLQPLCDFDLDRQLEDWLDYKLACARAAWRAKEGLDDDHIPSISPTFGMAEYSAWMGMEARLQETTCLPIPIVAGAEDLERVRLSEENKWFGYLRRGYDYLRSQKDGTFVLAFGGMTGPMDMANAVRGDDFFTDVALDPDFAHQLMRRMVDASLWFFEHLVSWCDAPDGGYVYQFGGFWMPARRPGHLTNDPAMLCSAQVYAEFGFPYERQLAEQYDGSLYHVHNAQMHFVPTVVTLPGLRVLQISNDPKTTPVPEDLERIHAIVPPHLPLMMHASSDQIRTHLRELRQRNVCLRVPCRDRADADDIVAFVRKESRPLR
jgi:hypothetical protein